ncbi:MAG: MerR family transcriptional regulator [Gemmatimonadota bacterium]|nr:MerR family transcriptional regulator [Gemmatimonadota bacterium]
MQASPMADISPTTMWIGEVARRAGVNVQTLRYYERRGLLPNPARRLSGYREYSADTVRLVRFIKRAQELGFSLQDAAELIGLRENPPRNRVAVRAVAVRKVTDIAARIRRLVAMQKALEQLVKACECGATSECPIIEALDDEPPAHVIEGRQRKLVSRGSYARS